MRTACAGQLTVIDCVIEYPCSLYSTCTSYTVYIHTCKCTCIITIIALFCIHVFVLCTCTRIFKYVLHVHVHVHVLHKIMFKTIDTIMLYVHLVIL